MEGGVFIVIFFIIYVIFSSSALFLFDKPWIAALIFVLGLGCFFFIADSDWKYRYDLKYLRSRSRSEAERIQDARITRWVAIFFGLLTFATFDFIMLTGCSRLLGTLYQNDYCLVLFSGWPFDLILATNVVPQKKFIWFFVVCSYIMSLLTASYLVTKCAFLSPKFRKFVTWLLKKSFFF
jgi:hypothetical protein